MPSDRDWYRALTLVEPKIRGIALVAIILEVITSAAIPFLPSSQRIYGLLVSAIVLIAALAAMVMVSKRKPQDHVQPDLNSRINDLKNKLLEGRFIPQLIIAISRGGLPVGGLLAKQLGDEDIVPVIALSPTPTGFDNSFNHISFNRQDFDARSADPIKILIVDDICRSGRTLTDATAFVSHRVDPEDFVIKTATLSFYDSHRRAVPPSFFVDRPKEAILDVSGDLERWPS